MKLAALMAVIATGMPSPSPVPTIHPETPCPDAGLVSRVEVDNARVYGCYVPGGDIYLTPGLLLTDVTVEHELGHAVDHQNIDPGERARIMRVVGWGAWQVEPFAGIYASCRLGLDPTDSTHRANRVYHGIKAKRVPAVCRLIARAAS